MPNIILIILLKTIKTRVTLIILLIQVILKDIITKKREIKIAIIETK